MNSLSLRENTASTSPPIKASGGFSTFQRLTLAKPWLGICGFSDPYWAKKIKNLISYFTIIRYCKKTFKNVVEAQ